MTAPLSVARLSPRRRRRLGLIVLVVLFALLLLLSNLVPLAAEWLWFQALGYERVFTTRLVAEAVLGVGVGGLVFAFLYVNLRIAQRGLVPNPLVVQLSSGAAAVDVTRLLRRLALPTALGLALLFGLGAAGGWLGVLQFLHRTPFGVTDPVFGRDVGYYVFTVPVIAGAIGLVIAVTTLTLLATIMLYVLRRDIIVFRRQVTVEPSARLHLAVRSEEHTSELQSQSNLVCRLLLEKKKKLVCILLSNVYLLAGSRVRLSARHVYRHPVCLFICFLSTYSYLTFVHSCASIYDSCTS